MRLSTKPFAAIGAVLFVYIVWKIGMGTITGGFLSMDASLYVLALLLFAPIIALRAYKWNILNKTQELGLESKSLVKFVMIGMFASLITPAKMGDFLRALYLKKEKSCSGAKAFSTVVVDKLFDFLMIFVIAILGSVFLVLSIGTASFFISIAIICIIVAFMLALLFNENLLFRVGGIFYRYLVPRRIKGAAKNTFEEFNFVIKNTRMGAYILATAVSWLVLYTQSYLIGLAFGISASYLSFISILAVTTIVTLLPITINGIGTREAALLFFLAPFGASSGQIVSFSIVLMITGLLVPGIIGLIIWARNPVSLEL